MAQERPFSFFICALCSNIQSFNKPRLIASNKKKISCFSVITISQECVIFMTVLVAGENLLNLLL